ncbi:unnamed protein product [marine sediment metagenome]|uniref:Uncharacterized protein n=1 Tax=marine sediment metagenome TaxID=412755 RepID=X1VP97_9ZZZZ
MNTYQSQDLQQFVDMELKNLISAYGYRPLGTSFEGRNVLDDAIGGHLGGFIFLAEDLKDYWVYDKEKAKVLVKHYRVSQATLYPLTHGYPLTQGCH